VDPQRKDRVWYGVEKGTWGDMIGEPGPAARGGGRGLSAPSQKIQKSPYKRGVLETFSKKSGTIFLPRERFGKSTEENLNLLKMPHTLWAERWRKK